MYWQETFLWMGEELKQRQGHIKYISFWHFILHSGLFLFVPCFPGECRAPTAATARQSETTAPSRPFAALCLTPPIFAQTSRSPAAGEKMDWHLKRMVKLRTELELSHDEPEILFTFRTSRVSRMAAHWEPLCARRATLWKLMKMSGWDWS